MVRWLARIFIALAFAGAAALYWLFYDNSAPKGADYALDITEIRRAAAEMPGADAQPGRSRDFVAPHGSRDRNGRRSRLEKD